MKKIFITFGDGSQDFRNASNRLYNQALNTKVFDECYGYTSEYLESLTDFWTLHEKFIKNNKRGYGYMIWKPYIILKQLEKMEENDILFFADAGCIITNDYIHNINIAIDYMINNDNIISQMNHITVLEISWNKNDLIKYLNLENNEKVLLSPQLETNQLLFKKTDKIYNFVKKWYEIMCNYHLINDNPSITTNDSTFKEHRHDQSVFSLLKKMTFEPTPFDYNIPQKIINVARYRRG